MKKKNVTRRDFLCSSAAVGAVIPLLGLVVACDSKPADGGGEAPKGGGGEAPAADGPICDLSKLSEADLAPRNALGYVDKTTIPEKTCENCNLLTQNPGCAGCTLFKGPVDPGGYCNSWAAKA